MRVNTFEYFHDGAWKTGYWDPTRGIFVGSYQGEVTTVITQATENYIRNLVRAGP